MARVSNISISQNQRLSGLMIELEYTVEFVLDDIALDQVYEIYTALLGEYYGLKDPTDVFSLDESSSMDEMQWIDGRSITPRAPGSYRIFIKHLWEHPHPLDLPLQAAVYITERETDKRLSAQDPTLARR